jgi:single-stranded-DNA-specific exonuclease
MSEKEFYLKDGDMNPKKQHYLLSKAEEARQLLEKHLERDHVVRIISHNDADGISAAGVICNTIAKNNGKFHVTIVPRLKEDMLERLSREKYKLFFFCDVGSSYVERIGKLRGDSIIADHHQTIDASGDQLNNVVHVNPHLHGIDGTHDVSASGVTYLTVRSMDNPELVGLALAGAIGDMQGQDGFEGVNQTILEEGLDNGQVNVQEDLRLAFIEEEPLYKALSYTFHPALPNVSGDLEGSQGFLERIGLSYGIKFHDLANEEKDILREELVKLNPKILGPTYTLPNEKPPIKILEDFSAIIDACGKNKQHNVGLSICLGDRDAALKEGMVLLNRYQDRLISGLEWIRKEGSQENDYIQFIYTDDKKRRSILGTLANVGLELGILKKDKPVLTLGRMHESVKVSARTTPEMINKGVNLGIAMDQASRSFNGSGGGHNIAAGAMIPYKDLENFKNLVDEMIKTQISS